jgi:hypothetical protein
MRTNKRAQTKWAFILSALVLAVSGACGSSKADATPTLSVEAVFTAAVQTLQAQQATQLALTPPTATASPSPFPTLALPSPAPTLPFVVPTTSGGSTASGCNNAAYVADVTIPDGTVEKPGASFDKTWTLLNTGSCAWNTSYKLAFFSGEGMSGSASAVPSTVNAGSQVNMTVKLVAPSKAGSYTGYWRMQNDQGQGFGGTVTVVITVSGNASASATAGPSPTATNTVSPADQTATAAAAPTSNGKVTISGKTGATSVTITWTGNKGGNGSAEFSGTWSIEVPVAWDGTVTPSKGQYVFTPDHYDFTNVQTDISGKDFSASLP